MKKILLIIVIILLLLTGYTLWKYALPGQVCGRPPGWFKDCFPGYKCKYPSPATGIDTDFGLCEKDIK